MKTLKCSCALVLASFLALIAPAVRAADHGDAPGVRLDNRLDLNDVYIFQSPVTPTNSVLIMTVSPVAGITGALTFNPEGLYEFVVDNDGDAKADQILELKFGKANATGGQKFTLTRSNGAGQKRKKLATGLTEADVSVKDGGTVRAGNFDDPFFFDLLAFRGGLSFCTANARNFFRGLNTLAIVIEVPTTSLQAVGSSKFGIWARTFQIERKSNGRVTTRKEVQFDRMGRPTINTVLVASANKDKFNKASPVNDRRDYEAGAITIMTSLGNTPAGAQTIGDILFPDILTYDPTSSSGFPNGRKLTDDVIDTALQLVTGNAAATDCISSDSSFRAVFPYLAVKNP